MNPKENILDEMIKQAVIDNDKPRPEIIFTTSIENNKQLEDALRRVGAFGNPIIGEGIESEQEMQDWEATTDVAGLGLSNL